MPARDLSSTRTFANLDAAACWRLVGDHGVGRVVFASDTCPQVIPTSYDAISGTAYFRAPTFGDLARRADRHVISLQVDDIDPSTLTGWSVQMSGEAHRVEDAATRASVWSLGRPHTWFLGAQTQWIAITVDHVQGQGVSH